MIRIVHRLKNITLGQILLFIVLASCVVFLVKHFSYYETWKSFSIVIPEDYTESYPKNIWLEQQLKIGDQIFDNRGKVIAVITDVQGIDVNEKYFLYITFNGLTSVSRISKVASFQNQMIIIENPLVIMTKYAQIKGNIVAINDNLQLENTRIRVTARYLNAQKWEINQIHAGDMITTLNKDVLVKITNIAYDKPTSQNSFIFNTKGIQNYFSVAQSSFPQDIILELELIATKSNDTWFFLHQFPLRTNEQLTLRFPHISLKNLIIQSVNYEVAK